jgi:hypothetical protein
MRVLGETATRPRGEGHNLGRATRHRRGVSEGGGGVDRQAAGAADLAAVGVDVDAELLPGDVDADDPEAADPRG